MIGETTVAMWMVLYKGKLERLHNEIEKWREK